ncbi:MAG: DUF951 domain-containing protein [Firmicutes bacterium]|nr:DUF951 domain-containing protein [Bacillota bacterium]
MLMFENGQYIRLRKKHPCGDDRWQILKAGVDMRIQCLTCQRVVLIPRVKLLKQIKEKLDTIT